MNRGLERYSWGSVLVAVVSRFISAGFKNVLFSVLAKTEFGINIIPAVMIAMPRDIKSKTLAV